MLAAAGAKRLVVEVCSGCGVQ